MRSQSGTFVIGGKPIAWRFNPVAGGWTIDLGVHAIQVFGEPSEAATKIAISAYDQGVQYGQSVGRAQIQNEFRNLMDCQPR